jgi:hypothetical protein
MVPFHSLNIFFPEAFHFMTNRKDIHNREQKLNYLCCQ